MNEKFELRINLTYKLKQRTILGIYHKNDKTILFTRQIKQI